MTGNESANLMAVKHELQRLQTGYALAVDGRNRDGLRAIFDADATFALYNPDEAVPTLEIRGHDRLVFLVDALDQRYAKTQHVMANHACDVDGDTATGSVYCTAYHLILDDGAPREFVVRMWYEDTFRRGSEGSWRIARREARFLWATEQPVLDWETARIRGRLG